MERLGAAIGREGRRPARGRPARTQVWSGRGVVGCGSREGETTPIARCRSTTGSALFFSFPFLFPLFSTSSRRSASRDSLGEAPLSLCLQPG